MTQDLFAKQVGGGGTGPEYAASIILFLAKAKLSEGAEQTGIIVTAKPNKNRFAKPYPIKFHISFDKGMNPYVGLEEYISWDNCGIERGKLLDEKTYLKLSEADKAQCKAHTYVKDGKEVTVYFQPSQTARKLCVKHLNDTVELNELFTSKVITEDVLKMLEPIAAKKYKYSTEELTQEDFSIMLNEDSTEEDY
jgi:hypothetical protein